MFFKSDGSLLFAGISVCIHLTIIIITFIIYLTMIIVIVILMTRF